MSLEHFPRLGYGCVRLSSCRSFAHAKSIVDHILACGIRYFDTAPGYGRGYSEKILGACLAQASMPRSHYLIATKLGAWDQPVPRIPPSLALRLKWLQRKALFSQTPPASRPVAAPGPISPYRISLEQVKSSFSRSLASLRVDYVDVLLLHESLPSFLTVEASEYLFRLRADGVVRCLGVAANGVNYLNLAQSDFRDWDVLQYESGPHWPQHVGFRESFSHMHHILHSCVGQRTLEGVSPNEALQHMLQSHPATTILFSSLNYRHIQDNAALVSH